MINKRIADGLETSWKSGTECFEWWTSPKADVPIDGQIDMEDFL